MALYMIQASYTAEGAKGLIKEGGTKRKEAAQKAAESLGGKLLSFYYTMGSDDIVTIGEFPDDVSATALSITIAASGGARCRTTSLLTAEQVDSAVRKTVGYRAPGA